MANGDDTRHHPKRKVSKTLEKELRDKAWLKWQIEGPKTGDINEAIEAHYQSLLNEHFGE